MAKRAVIISGGDMGDYSFYKDFICEDDYIICADGGSRHLIELDISPDLFLGDFDSCNFESLIRCDLFSSCEIKRFNCEKDVTDTHIAVDEALNRGYSHIVMLGCIGSRFDHTMANVYLLEYINKNLAFGELVNDKNIIRLYDSSFEIDMAEDRYISFLPFKDKVEGLTLMGLKYPLEKYTLRFGETVCISNEFEQKKAKVNFESGELLVFLSKD